MAAILVTKRYPCLCYSRFINSLKSITRRTRDEVVILQSCFLDVFPKHSDINVDKGFSLFDGCAARRVHLFPQEEVVLLPK